MGMHNSDTILPLTKVNLHEIGNFPVSCGSSYSYTRGDSREWCLVEEWRLLDYRNGGLRKQSTSRRGTSIFLREFDISSREIKDLNSYEALVVVQGHDVVGTLTIILWLRNILSKDAIVQRE